MMLLHVASAKHISLTAKLQLGLALATSWPYSMIQNHGKSVRIICPTILMYFVISLYFLCALLVPGCQQVITKATQLG